MQVKKAKINVHNLDLGMYVTELDRPWLESPFLFQGFLIDSEELLEQLKETCEFVYIDIEESIADIRPHIQTLSSSEPSTLVETDIVKQPRPEPTQGPADFYGELKQAKIIYDKTRSYIDTALNDVRLGDSVNTKQAKIGRAHV